MKMFPKLFFERALILGFGILHLVVPLFALPNLMAAPIHILSLSLEFGGLVIPGCVALSLLSIIFIYSKKIYFGAVLVLMYLSGAAFHILYFLGSFPSLITIPEGSLLFFLNIPLNSVLIIGIFLDILVSAVLFHYCSSILKR